MRDVTELRWRDRELMSKDATIREIHHRVKNNLQTVAALLRLQARRVTSAEALAALAEAERRVATIALVHETLSQTLDESVEFDDLIGRSLRLAADVATPGARVRTHIEGSFGLVLADDATALALVLTELVTNAVEHGLAGRDAGSVDIEVEQFVNRARVFGAIQTRERSTSWIRMRRRGTIHRRLERVDQRQLNRRLRTTGPWRGHHPRLQLQDHLLGHRCVVRGLRHVERLQRQPQHIVLALVVVAGDAVRANDGIEIL